MTAAPPATVIAPYRQGSEIVVARPRSKLRPCSVGGTGNPPRRYFAPVSRPTHGLNHEQTALGLALRSSSSASRCLENRQSHVDVGDHKLAVSMLGSGQPTVVLEDGGGGSIGSWSVIQPRIGEFTSVLAYTRAGRGASEAAKSPRTLMAVVEELRTLLHRSGTKPPYVLVRRSLGGIYVRAFAMKYPTEVAGLVLVDASHERQGIEFARRSGITVEEYLRKARSSVASKRKYLALPRYAHRNSAKRS
jgi:pimeloyl-ACP methyl ester carboxylesterase